MGLVPQAAAPEVASRAIRNANFLAGEAPFERGLAQWAAAGGVLERANRQSAVDRINQANRRGSSLLDLSGLKLTSLPPGLERLHRVTGLHLGDNMLHELPTLPPGLRHLDISHNQFFQAPLLREPLELLNIEGNGLPDAIPGQDQAIANYRLHLDSLGPRMLPSIAWSGPLPIAEMMSGQFARVIAAANETAPALYFGPLAGRPQANPARLAGDSALAHAMFNLQDPAESSLGDGQHAHPPLPAPSASLPLVYTPEEMADTMMAWHPARNVEGSAVNARWQQIAAEENAPVFVDFLQQLRLTADYKNDALRDTFERKVGDVMDAVLSSDTFRKTCFAIALDLSDTCQDGVALGLNNMTLALIDHEAEAGRFSREQLHDKGCNLFRIAAIDKIASRKIVELEKMHAADPTWDNKVDPVEVRLAYHVGLAPVFKLEGVVGDMLYHADSKIDGNDLAAAAKEVERLQAAGGHVAFLAEWMPWQKSIQRSDPAAYQRYEANRDEEREWLACKPVSMTDGAYLSALATQKQAESAALIRFTTRLTWQFMDQQAGPSA